MHTPFRPRYSVRTLAIVITLVCVYFGLWEATKRHAVPPYQTGQPKSRININDEGWIPLFQDQSPVPLIIACDGFKVTDTGLAQTRRYYCWFFGVGSHLLFEVEVEPSETFELF